MSDETTWTEVCKGVRFGDGLYSQCREKVKDYPSGGFRGGALDDVPSPEPDFEKQVLKKAIKIPEPPGKELLAKYPPGYGQEPEFLGMPLNKLMLYGGVALVALLVMVLRKKPQEITTTETPSADVTSSKAA